MEPAITSWAGLDLSRPQIMGVLNVTPDSFSDGGKFSSRDAALRRAETMISEGAAIIDIGGESTRPGAAPVSPSEELDRIGPVIENLRDSDAILSIDTRHSQTIRAAADLGGQIWNDVTALRGDPNAFTTAIDLGLPLCLMHMQGQPQTMQANPNYINVVDDVKTELLAQANALIAAGLTADKICLDVGIGFGKTLNHNLQLLKNLQSFTALPFAHLLGVSRKSYIQNVMGQDIPAEQRLPGSLATATLALSNGCRLFRVHDVAETRQAIEIAHKILTIS